MNDELTFMDVVIEAMPFSDEIIAWCHLHPEFKEALKVSNPDRFHALGMVETSSSPARPNDLVIGFTAYDMEAEFFKQDFIVDVGNQHSKFMLYTNLPDKNFGKYVHHINEFCSIYGQNGKYYVDVHHFDIARLHAKGNEQLSVMAESAIKKSQAIMAAGGRRSNSQAELKNTLAKIRAEKARNKSAG